jgi:hypothetical protein
MRPFTFTPSVAVEVGVSESSFRRAVGNVFGDILDFTFY